METKSTLKKNKWYGYYDLHLCQWNLREVINLKQNYPKCVSQATKKWDWMCCFMTEMEEFKKKRDGRSCLKESSNENFQAYLPQSLSDNILVSHKSQALQHHSKRHG